MGPIDFVSEGMRFERKLQRRAILATYKKDYINTWFCTISAPISDLSELDHLFEKDTFENISTDLANHEINRPDIYGFKKDTYKTSGNDMGYIESAHRRHTGSTRKAQARRDRWDRCLKRIEEDYWRELIDDLWEG